MTLNAYLYVSQADKIKVITGTSNTPVTLDVIRRDAGGMVTALVSVGGPVSPQWLSAALALEGRSTPHCWVGYHKLFNFHIYVS